MSVQQLESQYCQRRAYNGHGPAMDRRTGQIGIAQEIGQAVGQHVYQHRPEKAAEILIQIRHQQTH